MNLRQRVLISVLAYIVIWLAIFYAVLSPAYDYQRDNTRTVLASTNGLNWMRANASNADVQASNSAPVRRDNSLSLLSSTSRLHNIKVQRMQPLDNQVTVEISRQPYDSLIGWLVALETEHGFKMIDARIDKAADGVVDGRITLQ